MTPAETLIQLYQELTDEIQQLDVSQSLNRCGRQEHSPVLEALIQRSKELETKDSITYQRRPIRIKNYR